MSVVAAVWCGHQTDGQVSDHQVFDTFRINHRSFAFFPKREKFLFRIKSKVLRWNNQQNSFSNCRKQRKPLQKFVDNIFFSGNSKPYTFVVWFVICCKEMVLPNYIFSTSVALLGCNHGKHIRIHIRLTLNWNSFRYPFGILISHYI